MRLTDKERQNICEGIESLLTAFLREWSESIGKHDSSEPSKWHPNSHQSASFQ